MTSKGAAGGGDFKALARALKIDKTDPKAAEKLDKALKPRRRGEEEGIGSTAGRTQSEVLGQRHGLSHGSERALNPLTIAVSFLSINSRHPPPPHVQ
jgi:hypothetical protein